MVVTVGTAAFTVMEVVFFGDVPIDGSEWAATEEWRSRAESVDHTVVSMVSVAGRVASLPVAGSEVAILSRVLFFQLGDDVVSASKLTRHRSVVLKKPGESVTSLMVPPERETGITSVLRDVPELGSSFPIQE